MYPWLHLVYVVQLWSQYLTHLMYTGEGPGLGHSFEYSRRLQVDPDGEDIRCVVCLLPGQVRCFVRRLS